MKTAIDNNTALLSAAGRVLLATIFIVSALGKLAAPSATIGYIASPSDCPSPRSASLSPWQSNLVAA